METKGLDINFIEDAIRKILSKVHTDKYKLKPVVKHDRISMACPICGDSHRDMSQKRGHLFFNNLYYKCYNEDCRSTFTKLCNDFGVSIDATKRLEIINWIDQHIQYNKTEEDNILLNTFDKLITLDQLKEWFNSGKGPLKAFMQVNIGSQTYWYLHNRGIPDNLMQYFYEGVKYNGKWYEPYVVFVNQINGKVLGFQERNLESGKKRKFDIWNFERIYNAIHENEPLDPIEAISYNKVSCVFNIFNVNFERVVTVFEGYLDSVFFPNSLGIVGVNTDIRFLMNEDINLRFFFDNDNAGKRKAKSMLNEGYSVFLWDKFKEDWAIKHGGDKWININWFNDQIKDMNDIWQKLKIRPKELEKYFSTSVFDAMWITGDKKEKKKYIKKEKNLHNVNWDKISNDLLKNNTR